MNAIHELADLIAELPGVGPRQARRIVQYLLGKNPSFRQELSRKIETLSSAVFQCASCFRFAEGAGKTLCATCADENRDAKTLMIVEKDVDIDGVESANAYRGRYFVLGGLLSLARPKKNGLLRTKELLLRIQRNGIEEIIFALATTPEGDYTANEIFKELKGTWPNLTVTLLGRGLSVGAEIEYADQETLRSALKNRS